MYCVHVELYSQSLCRSLLHIVYLEHQEAECEISPTAGDANVANKKVTTLNAVL